MIPMQRLLYLIMMCHCMALIAGPRGAYAQLPSQGVVFDDFEYTSTTWCSEVNNTCEDYPNSQPPSGSVFGRNVWHTNTSGATTDTRAWYQYLWQEQEYQDTLTSFNLNGTGYHHLIFRADSGSHGGHESDGTKPRQIISGFTARRGTWAARVNFGDLEPANVADFVQAFWTLSLASGKATDGSTRWNEFDFEWNNRFNDTTQTYHYLRTGHTAGDVSSANASTSHEPLFSPAWPNPENGAGSPKNFDWSCKFVWGNHEYVSALNGQDCSRLINQDTVEVIIQQDTVKYTPLYDPGMILVLQITDNTVFYDIVSDGWGGVLVAHSEISNRIPNLPMAALFSQHIQSESKVGTTEDYSVDWFYYSPSTTININNVKQHVTYLRNTVSTSRFNNTGIGLERPFAHLPGIASTYNRANRTTPLSLDFSLNPTTMVPGSTTTLVALPPLRHGFYQYSWRYRQHYSNGSLSEWFSLITSNPSGWETTFTFPSGVARIEFEVRLEELQSPSNPVVLNNDTVSPITENFTIFADDNASAGGKTNLVSGLVGLKQNYPNPFNPVTKIHFGIPDPGHVTLVISDILGREVARLVDDQVSAGHHQVTWDASSFPSGVYIYHLRTPLLTQTRTMVLTK